MMSSLSSLATRIVAHERWLRSELSALDVKAPQLTG